MTEAGPDADLDVIFEDECLLVLNKPAGLLSVPGRGPDKQDCLSARAQARHGDALVVHRLDMATSGLLLMARGPHWQRVLITAFERREVHKQYEAVVDGDVWQAWRSLTPDPQGWALIDLPIAVDWPQRPRRVIAPAGQPSQTRWRPLEPESQKPAAASRVALMPLSGRTHQLRLHMQAIGHAILGDALYGNVMVQNRSPRLLLHACELGLLHPASQHPLHFHSPSPF